MTVYSDSFTRTAPLAGSSTDTGSGTWLGAGNTDGQNANVAGPAWLVAGTGDADLTAQVVSGEYAGIFGRGLANGTGGWRLECYYQTFSSGYYDTRPNYIGQYRVGAIQVDSRDQGACPAMGSLSNVSQCGNSNFASSYTQSCGSYGSNVTYYLQGVYQSGTCQVYVPGSYTVYYSRLLNPSGAVAWSGQTAYAPVLRLRLQSAAVTAWVNGTQVATATDSDAASRARTSVGIYSASGTASFTSFTVDTLNVPPNAPLVLEPASNAVVDRTQPVLLRWQFNDPDVSDTQSKYDLQYRPVGTETWTSQTAETPTARYSAPANTFADGAQIEWQVRTYDGQGVVGPWSATSYFRAGTPPPPPTWTAPLNGGQIPTESYLAQWSSASQVSFQVQVFADEGGSPTGAALSDSGEVTSTRRELQLTFATNNVTRHLRVRVQAGGLWSTWASVRATVSYTPPAVTRVFVTADEQAGRIFVDLRDPDPTGTQPAVLFHELYRSDAAGSEQRVAVALPLNGTWIDWTPASGVEQLYRAVAFGANGVTSTSALTA